MATADAKSTYAIELQDDTSGAASKAARALSDLKAKIDDDTKALSAMQRAMRNLKGASVVNASAVKELGDRIAAQKAKIAQAQGAYLSLGGTFDKVKPKTNQAAGGIEGLLGKLQNLRGLVAAGGPIAIAIMAIVGALGALVGALAAAAVALTRFGIASANARREELLQLEGLMTLRNWYGIAAGSATELQRSIDDVAASSALARGAINAHAQGLYRAGLRGQALRDTLEALAITESVQGAAGVARWRGRLIAEARAGRSARALAGVQSRLGALARRQMLGLDVQSRKLRESFDAIFRDVSIEPFLEGLNEITTLFSQNSVVGRALKTIVDAIFPPMLATLRRLAPVAQAFFEGLVIGALLVTIAVLRARNWLRRTFGDSELFANIDALKLAMYAGVAAIVLTAAVLGALAATAATLAAPFIAGAVAVVWLGQKLRALVDWFRATDFTSLGAAIADGLVAGIRNGVARVTGAVRGLASSAREALAGALQIRSPSRIFAGLGTQIPAGLEQGITAGAPRVAGAVDRLVEVPADAEAPSGAGGPAARAEMHISIGPVHVHTQATDAQGIGQDLGAELARILEGLAVTAGAPT